MLWAKFTQNGWLVNVILQGPSIIPSTPPLCTPLTIVIQNYCKNKSLYIQLRLGFHLVMKPRLTAIFLLGVLPSCSGTLQQPCPALVIHKSVFDKLHTVYTLVPTDQGQWQMAAFEKCKTGCAYHRAGSANQTEVYCFPAANPEDPVSDTCTEIRGRRKIIGNHIDLEEFYLNNLILNVCFDIELLE